MRKKKNLLPRMDRASQVLIREPETLRGRWLTVFPQFKSLHVELGCGKGRFTAETARIRPEELLCAVERVPDAMVVGMERVIALELDNVRFLDRDVRTLPGIFAPGEVGLFYLNFCDPWPKSRDAKHRLTAPDYLRMYAGMLCNGGKVAFKTDNLPLFRWSLEQFAADGWELREVTEDLHAGGVQGVLTDYEEKFLRDGMPIKRLVAVKTAETKTPDSGPVPRLRNASLSDARGYAESLAAHAEAGAIQKEG